MNVMISVIVPVYNVEKYLCECIDSIIEQHNCSFEIICVNDGSTDSSLNILNKYEREYEYIHVYSRSNKGLSATRNYGLSKAKGKYIYFLDSDDMLADEYCLATMVTAMEKNHLEVFCFDGMAFSDSQKMEKEQTKYAMAYKRKNSYGIYESGIELLKAMLANGEYQVNTALKCFSREFLINGNLLFKENILYEDNIHNLEVMYRAKHISHENKIMFLRRVRDDSIMHSKIKFNNFYSWLYIYIWLKDFWRSNDCVQISRELKIFIEEIKNNAIDQFSILDDGEKEKLYAISDYEKYVVESELRINIRGNDFESLVFPYHIIPAGSNVILYGAGKYGKILYEIAKFDALVNIIGIIDTYRESFEHKYVQFYKPNSLGTVEYDYILITVKNAKIAGEISQELINCGVPEGKIKWDGDIYTKQRYADYIYQKDKFINENLNRCSKRIFLFMLPEHGNTGDYIIAEAEKKFFEDYFPKYSLICVTTNEWIHLKKMISDSVKDSDAIVISGGGFIGDLWGSGAICMEIAKTFSNNSVIFLPNTFTYKKYLGQQIKEDLNEIMKNDKTVLFFRDEKSYNLCCELGFESRCLCSPDMALYSKRSLSNNIRRKRVLICLRDDIESASSVLGEKIENLLKNSGISFDKYDIHMKRYIPQIESIKLIESNVEIFKQYSCIITDRLHAMILAYLTGTPCIVFDNTTNKVSGVYKRWLSASEGVHFFDDYDERGILSQIDNSYGCNVDELDYSNEFNEIYEVIANMIEVNQEH